MGVRPLAERKKPMRKEDALNPILTNRSPVITLARNTLYPGCGTRAWRVLIPVATETNNSSPSSCNVFGGP